jgi:hypothetical protein
VKIALIAIVFCLPAAAELLTFRVVFGLAQDRPTNYFGSVSIVPGRVVAVQPWRLGTGDSIEGSSWKLTVRRAQFENQPDSARPMMTSPPVTNIVPAGVVVTVDGAEFDRVTIKLPGEEMSFSARALMDRKVIQASGSDILIEPALTVEQVSPPAQEQSDYPSLAAASDGSFWAAWQAYQDGGDHVYIRQSTSSGWSEPQRLTGEKVDVFRTAAAEDSKSRIWVVWSERSGDQWDLIGRRFDQGRWHPRQKITSGNSPNIFHRLIAAPGRDPYLVWVGHENGASHVYWSRLEGDAWSPPQTASGPSAWHPEAALDSRGNLWVTWDSYRNGNYDIFLRRIGFDGTLGEEMQVTRSALFQAHPTIAIDREDRIWLAWHEANANWGKDWTHEDPNRGTVLYESRSPKIAVLEGAQWREPAGVMTAAPLRYRRYVQYPRIAADSNGRIWLALQVRTSTAHNRGDYWAFDGRWEHYLTTLEGDRWSHFMPIPQSSARPEGPLMVLAAANGVHLVWTNDNRPLFAPSFYAAIPNHYEIFAARLAATSPKRQLELDPFSERNVNISAIHPAEPEDVARVRAYRSSFGGKMLRILRGDFHRHTEISSDGAGDGSLEDYFRYMIDAAAMDTGIVGDHNIGNDDEYSWWRTEKAIDLFLIPGRYTPMFGYERSPNFPNGHRNVVFAQRGVRTLPIPPEEFKGAIPSGPILYPYLKKHNGIAMVHSSATSQGTDWRDNDPEVEPLVELYQGYHASYEYEGAPRAESPNLRVVVHGRYEPAGFWWNALAKGYRLGVQSSSDHISTHTSYTMIYSPGNSRSEILESMRSRHAYAGTDNIIVDVQAEADNGRIYMMGDAFRAKSAPNLRFKIIGTDRIAVVDIIKDQKFVYHSEPNQQTVEFAFRDKEPGGSESYYYIRVQQRDRNMAWSSPMWIDYR